MALTFCDSFQIRIAALNDDISDDEDDDNFIIEKRTKEAQVRISLSALLDRQYLINYLLFSIYNKLYIVVITCKQCYKLLSSHSTSQPFCEHYCHQGCAVH